jgi:hypothetical protein
MHASAGAGSRSHRKGQKPGGHGGGFNSPKRGNGNGSKPSWMKELGGSKDHAKPAAVRFGE